MDYTFKKGERLKSRKLIEQLFIEGKRIKSNPVQMVYLPIEHTSEFLFQAGFSVGKKRFKKAVTRNRIKRLMREAYRLHKNILPELNDEMHTKKHVFMFMYVADKLITYQAIEKSMIDLLEKFKKVYKTIK